MHHKSCVHTNKNKLEKYNTQLHGTQFKKPCKLVFGNNICNEKENYKGDSAAAVSTVKKRPYSE